MIDGGESGGRLFWSGFSRKRTLRWKLVWTMLIRKCSGFQQLQREGKEKDYRDRGEGKVSLWVSLSETP